MGGRRGERVPRMTDLTRILASRQPASQCCMHSTQQRCMTGSNDEPGSTIPSTAAETSRPHPRKLMPEWLLRLISHVRLVE